MNGITKPKNPESIGGTYYVLRTAPWRVLCRSKLNGAAEKKIAAYSCFWPQNQSNSYFDLCQKHEKTSPQNKFSRLVMTGTVTNTRPYSTAQINAYALVFGLCAVLCAAWALIHLRTLYFLKLPAIRISEMLFPVRRQVAACSLLALIPLQNTDNEGSFMPIRSVIQLEWIRVGPQFDESLFSA